MRMFQRRRKLTPEETAANVAAREARKQKAMHCQVCNRAILANKGTIAHHGYTRPGHGWQTSSCYGAKRLPFEVDRAALGEFINFLYNTRESMIQTLDKVRKEEIPLTLSYQEWTRVDKYTGKYFSKHFDVRRETWDSVKEEQSNSFRERNPRMCNDLFTSNHWTSFDHVLALVIANRETEIRHIEADIKEFTKRFDGWKQTHKRNHDTNQWESV